jgi:hypothetical protein
MAILSGNLAFTTQASASTSNPDFGQLEEPDYLDSWLTTLAIFGTKSNTQPVDENQQSRAGMVAAQFNFLDFYNRIHVTPTRIDLGNVISTVQREISVWNAFFVSRVLNLITSAGDEGLSIDDPVGQPFAYGPLQEVIYTVTASTAGPPTIAASYTFDFDVVDLTVEITGVRVVAWIWEANWIEPPLEKLEWNTDIIQGDDGSEQRRQLRQYPRIWWEFTYDVADSQRRLFENILYAWGARVWALPIWSDIHHLETEVLAAATVIPVPTAGTDYHVNGLGILIGPDGLYESFEVETVNAESVEIQRPLVNTWGAGTRVYPARGARLQDPRGFGRMHRNYVRGVARFKTEEEIAGTALTETSYRGYPVMTIEPNWRDAPEIDYQRKLAMRAFGTGKDETEDEAELALPLHAWRWTCLTREDVTIFRQWLYARRGRQKAIWVPTSADDLKLVSVVAPSDTHMVFEACGLVHFAAGDVHRRDIRILLTDGRVFYRRLSDFITVSDELERATINAIFNEEVRPEDVESISWMHLLRMDTDSIEIAWQSAGCTEAQIVMKGPRNDV